MADITINSILTFIGVILTLSAFVGVVVSAYKAITDAHDRAQKWDEYDKQIKDIKDEQCMLTYCMYATLDGLHQLGCNGKVTQAREDLQKYINKSAHGVE